MEKMRKVIQNFLAVYMRVVTLVVFVSAVYIVVFWGWKTELDVTILWEILGVSFLTSLGSVIAFPVSDSEKEISKQAMLIPESALFSVCKYGGFGLWLLVRLVLYFRLADDRRDGGVYRIRLLQCGRDQLLYGEPCR